MTGLSSQMQTVNEEVKLSIYAAIDEPPDQMPIKFRDATGEKYRVPLNLCRNFEVRVPAGCCNCPLLLRTN